MKSFFKYVFASVLGISLFFILCFILLIASFSAVSFMGNKPYELEDNTIFELKLQGTLQERHSEDITQLFLGDNLSSMGLDDILSSIKKAEQNKGIKGIYLNIKPFTASVSSLQEIRQALEKFKKSNKFVVAYADNLGNGTYYLASVANKIYLNPNGTLAINGLSINVSFYKNLLNKLGIEMQIFKVGTFKSAVEPYTLEKMSNENREQLTKFLSSVWGNMTASIAESRNISTETINSFANEGKFMSKPQIAVEQKLIDSLVYESDMKPILEKLTTEKFNSVSLSEVKRIKSKDKVYPNKIAVVYAVGAIDANSTSSMKSEEIVEELLKVAENDKIKAVVLRVNSPGGALFGSDAMWYATSKVKAKKPLIVSMGDCAASGGYYISCHADRIFAQANTLTGSIGIFGMIPNINKLADNIGVKFDVVKTNTFADMINFSRPMSSQEKIIMQKNVENGYEQFIERCANGRGKTVEQIKTVAEGRVYSGADALSIGLVDELGSLADAIEFAASKAELKEYSLRYYPATKDWMTELFKSFSTSVESRFMKMYLGDNYKYLNGIREVQNVSGVQAIMPFELVVD